MTTSDIIAAARSLLVQCQRGTLQSVEPLAGGRNNRVYRVTSDQTTAILKHYYRSATGGHDRWASEVAWCTFCDRFHVGWTPVLWAADRSTNCALFEELPGRRVTADDVDAVAVGMAVGFVISLNRPGMLSDATGLPVASEACFTWRDHEECIQRRIDRFTAFIPQDDLDAAMQHWITTELIPVWEQARRHLRDSLTESELQYPLPQNLRCLSPSDFGFHNAWRLPSGDLRFLDFEYAGWDDPAKLVCDFYWQVDLPAPRETWPRMIAALTDNPDWLTQRVRRLFPAMGIKWCGIVLNEFLRTERDRRDFAGESIDDPRQRQWDKARVLLQDVTAVINTPWPPVRD